MRMLFVFTSMFIYGALAFGQDTPEDKKQVRKAVLKWADETFEYYDEPRFENYEAVPSPMYFQLQMQHQTLKEFKEEIVFNYGEGKSDRTLEELKEDTARISGNIKDLENKMSTIDSKVDHFEVYMWANIKTNNGLTVYYQHFFKLSPDYKITHKEISSYVGKKDDTIEIVYKD